eukprot:149994-Chlamydomonas_euryale.AAC.1
MVAARTAAAAALEALKLRYTAARRDESRMMLEGAKAWRVGLQAAAGQHVGAADAARLALRPPTATDKQGGGWGSAGASAVQVQRTTGGRVASAPAARRDSSVVRPGALSRSAAHGSGGGGCGKVGSATLVEELDTIWAEVHAR